MKYTKCKKYMKRKKCENCKKCKRKLESLPKEPQYLLSQYQICEGAECTNKIMVELIGENNTNISKAVDEFQDVSAFISLYLHLQTWRVDQSGTTPYLL